MNLEPRHLRLLGQFQLLEFSLKLYIVYCHEVIRAKLGGVLPFKHSFEQVDGFPLEKLLANYKLLSDNTDLQIRIGKLVKRRNKLAHKNLMLQDLGHTSLVFGIYRVNSCEMLKELSETEREVAVCMEQLAPEIARVKGIFEATRV